MMPANLELSKKEFETIINSEFILTKNRITEKIFTLFGTVSEVYKIQLNQCKLKLPEEIFLIAPKIYKGEQYENLPYVMMDFPRVFSKENVFAIRSFFWWGNYFSITLHVSGKYKMMFAKNILSNLILLQKSDWYFNAGESEWLHHFNPDNYTSFNALNDVNKAEIKNRSFLKIAKKLSLENWQTADIFFTENFQTLLKIVSNT